MCLHAYILEVCAKHQTQHERERFTSLLFRPLLLPPAIPFYPPRTRLTGEQASETPALDILYGRGPIRFLGSIFYTTAHLRSSASTTSSTSSSSPWLLTLKELLPTRLLHGGRPTRLLLLRPTGLLEGIISLSRSYLFPYAQY